MMGKQADSMRNWSNIGVELAKRGADLNCPHCGQILRGQRYCPQCGMMIKYAGETDQSIQTDLRLAKAMGVSEGLESAGKSMSSFGSSMIWGCTVPIIILILLFLFL